MNRTSCNLNKSISKEMHSFAKSDRFPKINSYTRATNPSPMTSDFDKTVKKGIGKDRHSFGTR